MQISEAVTARYTSYVPAAHMLKVMRPDMMTIFCLFVYPSAIIQMHSQSCDFTVTCLYLKGYVPYVYFKRPSSEAY
jgi:hypothetical protein